MRYVDGHSKVNKKLEPFFYSNRKSIGLKGIWGMRQMSPVNFSDMIVTFRT